LEKLSAVLTEDDRLRMQRCLPWEPEIERYRYQADKNLEFRESLGIRGCRSMNEENENDYCLTMCFKRDKVLQEYEAKYHMDPSRELLVLGCVWTSVRAGNQFAAIASTAATTEMSLLFNRSPQIKRTWMNLAQGMKAIALFFDREEGDRWNLIYPAKRKVLKPDDEACWVADCLVVDAYYQDAFRLAGLKNSTLKPPVSRP
jgi:hypothetical protein